MDNKLVNFSPGLALTSLRTNRPKVTVLVHDTFLLLPVNVNTLELLLNTLLSLFHFEPERLSCLNAGGYVSETMENERVQRQLRTLQSSTVGCFRPKNCVPSSNVGDLRKPTGCGRNKICRRTTRI